MDAKTEGSSTKVRISVFDPRNLGLLGRISERMDKTGLTYKKLYSTLLITAKNRKTVAEAVDAVIARRSFDGEDGKTYNVSSLAKEEDSARWRITYRKTVIGWVDIRELA